MKSLKGCKHLDEWVSATDIKNDLKPKNKVVVDQEKTEVKASIEKKDIDEETKVFLVRNAMSLDFMEHIKQETNKSLFMDYVNEEDKMVQSGRKIRIVSEKDSEFLVGKGAKTKRYGSVCMEEFEEKLLASLNQLIKMYRSFCQQVLNINVRMADQLQIVKDSIANGGYGSHNDQSTPSLLLFRE